MIMEEQDSGLLQWGLHFFECDPYLHSVYHGGMVEHDANDIYDGQYFRDHTDAECNQVENDEIIACTLQEEFSQDFSQLALPEDSQYSHVGEDHLQHSIQDHDWHNLSTRDYSSGYGCGQDESDDMGPSCSWSSPGDGEEDSYILELSGECMLDEEVGKRLNQIIPIPVAWGAIFSFEWCAVIGFLRKFCIPFSLEIYIVQVHVPRINAEIPSIVEATTDHERLLSRLRSNAFVEHKVQGDGNCQFCALSDKLYYTPEHHKYVRRQVVNQFGVRIIVITSFKDTFYIEILPNAKNPKGVICLSFWAEVHYSSVYSQEDVPSQESRRKKRWWNLGK